MSFDLMNNTLFLDNIVMFFLDIVILYKFQILFVVHHESQQIFH